MPMLPRASSLATPYDTLFLALVFLATLFAAGVLTMTIFFAIRYREGSNVPRKRPEHENLKLESVLIGGPLLLGLGMFAWGAKLYSQERYPPKNATEIFVIGKQWMWHIQHANGIREMDALTVPVGKPVTLTMISQDVIHAFYVPAFRAQYQVLPGRYTSLWFTPTQTGRFLLLCNLYCGTDHSRMVGHVDVLTQPDYDRWVAEQEQSNGGKTPTTVDEGRKLFAQNSCGSCHTDTDTLKGPSLYGIYGKARSLTDGEVVSADDEYLRAAILRPEAQIVAGYGRTMPAYPNLDERQVWDLIAYLKSLRRPEAAAPVEQNR